jgi:hypothetical protein
LAARQPSWVQQQIRSREPVITDNFNHLAQGNSRLCRQKRYHHVDGHLEVGASAMKYFTDQFDLTNDMLMLKSATIRFVTGDENNHRR